MKNNKEKYEWNYFHQEGSRYPKGFWILDLYTPWTAEDRNLAFSQTSRELDKLRHNISLDYLGEDYKLTQWNVNSDSYNGSSDLVICFNLSFNSPKISSLGDLLLYNGEIKHRRIRTNQNLTGSNDDLDPKRFLEYLNRFISSSIFMSGSESPYSPKYFPQFILNSNLPEIVKEKLKCFTKK